MTQVINQAIRPLALMFETDWNKRLVELVAARHVYQQNRPTLQ